MSTIRVLALVILTFLLCSQAKGQLSFVQYNANLTNASSLGVAYPGSTTLHSLLVVQFLIFGSGGCALTSVTDTHTNTWVSAQTTGGTGCNVTGSWFVYYVQSNNSAGADTVTITGNGSVSTVDMAILEYTNQNASALDVAGTPIYNNISSTTVSFPTITTTQTNETIIAFARLSVHPNTVTQGAGYTNRWANPVQATSLEIPADGTFGPGSHTTTFTITSADNNDFSNLIAFKATNSNLPSTAPPPYIIKYHPPEKLTPQLFYTVLRNWIKEMYEDRT